MMYMEKEAYPKPLVRVTGGKGGEAVLIVGSEKTALHDCGMACFSEELISNIEKALQERPLDYVLLSHTHYDHMGALPGCHKTMASSQSMRQRQSCPGLWQAGGP